jgi:hypothetical protein
MHVQEIAVGVSEQAPAEEGGLHEVDYKAPEGSKSESEADENAEQDSASESDSSDGNTSGQEDGSTESEESVVDADRE